MDSEKFELEPFQEPGYNKLVAQFRHLLLYAMGLGKTVVATKAMYDVQAKCVLIVCPKNAIKTWENHIRLWFDGLDVASGKTTDDTETSFHIWRWRKRSNDAEARRTLWRSRDRGAKVNVYITTFAAFTRDNEHFIQPYDCIIVDEAKRIRSRKSQAFLYLKPLVREAKYLWLLTGTPGRRPDHFWTMFHLLDPKLYGSYWRFVGAYAVTVKNSFGGMEIVAFKNRDSWFDLLRRKATILTKEDIGHTPTIRGTLYAELDDDQSRLYKEMEEDMMMVVGDTLSIASTAMTQVLRYRQLLVCPKIIDPSLSIGGAFADLVETLKEEDTDPQIVIFCPFTAAFPYFIQYLADHGFTGVQTLQGGLNPDDQESRIETFRKGKVPIICSIMYAQSFSLEPAKQAFFIGYEWDPEDNAQAEERLNRLTTKHPVNAWYYCYEGTYDEQQCHIVNFKHRQKNMILPKRDSKLTIDTF